MVHGEHVELDVPVNLNMAVRVLGAVRWRRRMKPRWLVYQTMAKGAQNREVIIYAETFWRKKRAEETQRKRNQGIPNFGNRTFGSKRWALIVELPAADGKLNMFA